VKHLTPEAYELIKGNEPTHSMGSTPSGHDIRGGKWRDLGHFAEDHKDLDSKGHAELAKWHGRLAGTEWQPSSDKLKDFAKTSNANNAWHRDMRRLHTGMGKYKAGLLGTAPVADAMQGGDKVVSSAGQAWGDTGYAAGQRKTLKQVGREKRAAAGMEHHSRYEEGGEEAESPSDRMRQQHSRGKNDPSGGHRR